MDRAEPLSLLQYQSWGQLVPVLTGLIIQCSSIWSSTPGIFPSWPHLLLLPIEQRKMASRKLFKEWVFHPQTEDTAAGKRQNMRKSQRNFRVSENAEFWVGEKKWLSKTEETSGRSSPFPSIMWRHKEKMAIRNQETESGSQSLLDTKLIGIIILDIWICWTSKYKILL